MYTKLTPEERYRRPIVSWHTHSNIWDCRESALRQIEHMINLRYHSLVPGLPAAKLSEPMTLDDMLCDLWYNLKAP